VPVGEDQDQHLELAREIVRRFNNQYGEVFPEPQVEPSKARRVIGLDGIQKMSKSKGNEIGLLDTFEEIGAKLRGAKADPKRLTRKDPGEPNDCNIFSLHGFFTAAEHRAEIARDCRSAAIGCVDCKKVLQKGIFAVTGPIRERALALDDATVNDILEQGARRARREASATMTLVRDKAGLRQPARWEV
jgi:tryptophanyl-tRNA synthetase